MKHATTFAASSLLVLLCLSPSSARANEPLFGEFEALTDVPVGAVATIAVDLNRDGSTDLVVCAPSALGVWNGGESSAWVVIDDSLGCISLDVADADQDGWLDLVYTTGGNGVRVAYGPTHALSTVIAGSGSATATQARFIDLGGDAYSDLVFARSGEEIRFRTGNDDRAWSTPAAPIAPLDMLAEPQQIAVIDWNFDGLDDLVVLDAGSRMAVWERERDTGFVQVDVTTLPYEAFAMLDFDRDALPEALVWNSEGGLGVASPSESWLTRLLPEAVGRRSAAAGDLNADGRLDVVALEDGSVAAYFDSEGEWSQLVLTDSDASASARLFVIDADGDYDLDLVVADSGGMRLSENLTPHFAVRVGARVNLPGTFRNPRYGFVADIDEDGDPDIVASDSDTGINLFRQRGALDGTSWATSNLTDVTVYAAALADVDLDGDIDLMAINNGLNALRWFENDGSMSAWALQPTGTERIDGMLPGDLDHDGDVDVVASAQAGGMIWLENDGSTDWPVHAIETSATDYGDLALADIDGDGDLDALVEEGADDEWHIVWFEHPGDPDGTWTRRIVHTRTSSIFGLHTADVDRDGATDLFYTTDDRAHLLSHGGAPTTTPWTILDTSAGGQNGGHPADMDNDGYIELAASSGRNVRVQWWDPVAERLNTIGGPGVNPLRLTRPADIDRDGDLDLVITTDSQVGWFATERRTATASGDTNTQRRIRPPARASIRTLNLNHHGRFDDIAIVPAIVTIDATHDGEPFDAHALADGLEFFVYVNADEDGGWNEDADTLVPGTTDRVEDGALIVELPVSDERLHVAPGVGAWFFLVAAPTVEFMQGPRRDIDFSFDIVWRTAEFGSAVDWATDNLRDFTLRAGNSPISTPPRELVVEEGGVATFDPLEGFRDPDGDGLLVAGIAGSPRHGWADFGDDVIAYRHGGGEAPDDLFVYEFTDGIDFWQVLVAVSVVPVDDPPYAEDADAETVEDTPLPIRLAGGDVDSVPTYELVAEPEHGTLVVSPETGVGTYTPRPNYVGDDRIEWRVEGDGIVTDSAALSIAVTATDRDDDDGDGVVDRYDVCPDVEDDQSDLDADGVGDACDDDIDGDGIDNAADPCPLLADAPESVCGLDDDGDGVPDREDNCPLDANPTQDDGDGDGLGDVCDLDQDGDGVLDGEDNCPHVGNRDQLNTDGDGDGDACDGDDDGDGVADEDDVCPLARDPEQGDVDGDGVGDACSDDVDGDGVVAREDCDDTDPGVASTRLFYPDVDGDGLGDGDAPATLCSPIAPEGYAIDGTDNCPDVANADQADADRDGVGDACDDTSESDAGAGADTGFDAGSDAADGGSEEDADTASAAGSGGGSTGCTSAPSGPPVSVFWLLIAAAAVRLRRWPIASTERRRHLPAGDTREELQRS